MRRKRHLLAAAGVLAATFLLSGMAAVLSAPDDPGSAYGYLRLFNEVLALVKNSYVEPVPQDDLMKGAYEGLLASLDGESEYITAAQHRLSREARAGGDADAGVFLTKRDGVLFVAAVLQASDAQARGLRLGDQVRRIGDRAGREMTFLEATRALKGPAGSKLILSVSRREEPRREDVEVVRKRIALPPPKFDGVQEGVAIARIPAFGPGAARALSGILDRLHKDRVHKAVFDLRGNAWGDVEEAARSVALFTGEGVVARLRDRRGEETPLRGSGTKSPWKGEILLLTDAGAAYATEVFVAALVDAGLARHGGETTLGLGGQREMLPLGNGDFISLTVRKLVSPSGKAWHGKGLIPSVPIGADLTAPFKERSDRQLRKAVEALRDSAPEAKAA